MKNSVHFYVDEKLIILCHNPFGFSDLLFYFLKQIDTITDEMRRTRTRVSLSLSTYIHFHHERLRQSVTSLSFIL